MPFILKYFYVSILFTIVRGQFYEDKRCRCICPSPAAVFNSSITDRKIYTGNVPPNKCNCHEVILPRVGAEIKGHEQEFCPRCECKYERRNTTIIMLLIDTGLLVFRATEITLYEDEISRLSLSNCVLYLSPATVQILPQNNINGLHTDDDDDAPQVVVIMLLWVMTMLSVYMGFLICLDPLINKKRVKYYQERGTDEARTLLIQDDDGGN